MTDGSSKKFQRTVEDFTCEHCGMTVIGTGYTNHCPVCLWSKHVDVYPGDRMALCGGMMEPEEVELENGEYSILHRCVVCGYAKKNKTDENDNFDAIITLSADLNK